MAAVTLLAAMPVLCAEKTTLLNVVSVPHHMLTSGDGKCCAVCMAQKMGKVRSQNVLFPLENRPTHIAHSHTSVLSLWSCCVLEAVLACR